ncbi:Two component response regulator [Legionella birminghamensis]|uniref:Response regulator containing a CheY-like receiver domain and an HD-GYP domain n=1 Tax=Legionella birminghamensis TaxID=28083 RepID=A0A378IDP9_9GAMM|nr:response regulator [Legionella birminghamensis]KTC72583.1 Two component response regulator [Legionella birminghamensis]STX32855.1 Response regulator containing a CheY-like receiver domain and an HD-GYP domain [Legionella birminghamensis]
MQHLSIPACYFPSTALFIDDSRDFLLNFVLQLDEGLAYRIFDSPFDALDFLEKKRCQLETLNHRCTTEFEEIKASHSTDLGINNSLAAIHAEIYNQKRFTEVSVIVVDYAMPGMNGLEFCRRLANTNIKKILLTGKADEKLAIQAFNEGLIHRYIHKSDPQAAELITKSISDLQQQYFQAMSDNLVRMLNIPVPHCLHDAKFSYFFRQFCKEKGIVEHYLADYSGSFMLLDDDANVSFLITKTLADLEAHFSLARRNGANESVLEELARGLKIPCYWQRNEVIPEWNDWFSCLVPAQRLEADHTYFYSYVSGPLLFDVDQDKLQSYHQYLEEIDAEELLLL